MTLSVRSTAIRVRHLLGSRGQDVSNLRTPRIAALIAPALEALAYRVAEGPRYRGLQKALSATPIAGQVTSSNLGGSGVILNLARTRIREQVSGTMLTPVDSVYLLANGDLPTDQIYYAQEGAGLRFRGLDGLLDTYATTLVVTANFIPLLIELPIDYEGMFIETLGGLLTEPRPEGRAIELSEAGRA